MSKQTPMMQLRDSLKLKIREAIKTLPDSTFREVALRYDSLLKEIEDKYLPIEQQAIIYDFDEGVMEAVNRPIGEDIINGRDYYNKTYKS